MFATIFSVTHQIVKTLGLQAIGICFSKFIFIVGICFNDSVLAQCFKAATDNMYTNESGFLPTSLTYKHWWKAKCDV